MWDFSRIRVSVLRRKEDFFKIFVFEGFEFLIFGVFWVCRKRFYCKIEVIRF